MFENVIKHIDKRCIGEKKVPYIGVIVCKEDKELFRYFTGEDKWINGDELLIMYSASKPITTLLCAKLVEECKLSFSDKVSKYLPEYENAFIIDENGNKVKPKTDMTIEHLLTMSGGFDYNFYTQPLIELYDRTQDQCSTLEVVNAFVKSPLLFNPGERFCYSLCLDVIGAVIEVASGMRFSEYANEKIFKPLGMKSATFDNRFITEKDCYKFYCANIDGTITPFSNLKREYVSLPNYESGGAGLKCTANDYVKFAKMLAMGGVSESGERIISQELLTKYSTPKMGNSPKYQETFDCVHGNDCYTYGYGVRCRKVATEWGLPIGEYGWDGAFGSYLMVDPVNKISVVMGMNIYNWYNVFRWEHLRIVEEIYKELAENDLL